MILYIQYNGFDACLRVMFCHIMPCQETRVANEEDKSENREHVRVRVVHYTFCLVYNYKERLISMRCKECKGEI
jgi:hypothetical protein